jgi:hypothetical protein
MGYDIYIPDFNDALLRLDKVLTKLRALGSTRRKSV